MIFGKIADIHKIIRHLGDEGLINIHRLRDLLLCGLTDTPKSRRWAGSATALPVQSREQISPCGPVPRFEDDAPARLIIGNRGDEIGPRRAVAALVRYFRPGLAQCRAAPQAHLGAAPRALVCRH